MNTISPRKVSKAVMPPAPYYKPGEKNPKTLILADIRWNDERDVIIKEISKISQEYPLVIALCRYPLPLKLKFIPEFILVTGDYSPLKSRTAFNKEFYRKGKRVYGLQTLEDILNNYQPHMIDFVGNNDVEFFDRFVSDVKKLDFETEVKDLQLGEQS